MHNVGVKLKLLKLFKIEIISKLYAVKICAYLSEHPGTELEGSVVPIIGVGWRSAMCETK